MKEIFFARLSVTKKQYPQDKSKRKRFWSTLAGLIVSSIIIGGCGTAPEIKQAQEFGKLKGQFENNTNKLAEEFYASCIRRLAYFAVREGTAAREQALKSCETRNKPTVEEVKDANKIVIDYIESIGKLAADDLVNFDDEFEKIKNSLNDLLIPTSSGNDQVALDNHSRIFNQIQMIRTVRNDFEIELVRAKVKEISIPDDSPGAKITNTTKKLIDAVKEINNVKKVLSTIAEVINIINCVIGVLATLAV